MHRIYKIQKVLYFGAEEIRLKIRLFVISRPDNRSKFEPHN